MLLTDVDQSSGSGDIQYIERNDLWSYIDWYELIL